MTAGAVKIGAGAKIGAGNNGAAGANNGPGAANTGPGSAGASKWLAVALETATRRVIAKMYDYLEVISFG